MTTSAGKHRFPKLKRSQISALLCSVLDIAVFVGGLEMFSFVKEMPQRGTLGREGDAEEEAVSSPCASAPFCSKNNGNNVEE